MINKILFVLLCVFPSISHAEISFLDKPLYPSPFANPRSSNSGMTFNYYKDQNNREFLYFEGSLGRELGIITWKKCNAISQLGIESTTWFTLLKPTDGMHFPLITQDFHVAFPISIQYKILTVAVKFNHISGHQGDGFREIVEVDPIPYSRDYMSLHGDIKLKTKRDYSYRFYGTIGYIHKTSIHLAYKWYTGGGIETISPNVGPVSFLTAQDLTWNGDVNTIDSHSKVGILFDERNNNYLRVGFGIDAYYGSDRRGQLFGQKITNISLGFFLR